MSTQLAIRQTQLQNWALTIKNCKDSGLKVDAFCAREGISRHAYYYWLKKVKEELYSQNGFVEICPEKTDQTDERQTNQENLANEKIDIRSGQLTITVPLSVSREKLEMIIGVISHAE